MLLACSCVYGKQPAYTYFYSDFPPLEYVGKNGQADGIIIRLVERQFAEHNIDIKFIYSSLKRGTGLLHSGAVDLVATIQPTPSSLETFETIGPPFTYINLSILRHNETPAITAIEQLKDVSLSKYAGASFFHLGEHHNEILAKRDEVDIADMDTAVRLIEAKKIRYFLTYSAPNQAPPCRQCTYDALESLPVFLTISKFHPQKEAHMEALKSAFEAL